MTDGTSAQVLIGRVIRLQIHLERITPNAGLYDSPAPETHLLPVETLLCDHRGVCGLTSDGVLKQDLHHKDHPLTHFRRANDISLMPLGHYARIRDEFGDHMVDGIVGENVLIDYEDVLTLEDLANGIMIGEGSRQLPIDAWRIATPCTPFSMFAAGIPRHETPDQRVTHALRFLNNGMRGFYGSLTDVHVAPVEIRIGDAVYLRRS